MWLKPRGQNESNTLKPWEQDDDEDDSDSDGFERETDDETLEPRYLVQTAPAESPGLNKRKGLRTPQSKMNSKLKALVE